MVQNYFFFLIFSSFLCFQLSSVDPLLNTCISQNADHRWQVPFEQTISRRSSHIKTFSIGKCIWKECQNLHFMSKNRTGVVDFELCFQAQRLHFASKGHDNELRVGILNTTSCGASRSDHPFKSYRTPSVSTLNFWVIRTGGVGQRVKSWHAAKGKQPRIAGPAKWQRANRPWGIATTR